MLNKRIFFLIFFIISSVCANVQDVEFLADNVKKVDTKTHANGNVIMYSKDYLVTSDMAIYDEKNEIAEFFGNVNLLKGKNETSKTTYLKLDLKNKENFAKENFMMDKEAEIWMQNKTSCTDQKYYRTKNSVVSSCNIENPDWKIKYTSGKLNKETKFLHLFNPVFYVGNVPVLYLPYFGFPTDKTRRTGLLIPEVGYISKEGFYYKQPIYFAPYESWDLQLDPQVRSTRGFGIYATFRFADSPYSYGEIRGGVFDNFKRAQERLEYKNEKHHGYEFDYDRSKLLGYLVNGEFKENLWIRFTNINDVEYYDLKEKSGSEEDGDSLATSKLNYYLTTDEHYFGAYARYYIDTDKLNSKNHFKNDDTLQELPTLHYHKFTNSAFLDNLLYSADFKAHNYTRKVGVTAKQYEFNLPLVFTTPLLNDWLNFKFAEALYATHIDYSKNYIYQNGEFYKDKSSDYVNNYHKFSLGTDIAKSYESYFHTMNLDLSYLIPGYQSGDINQRLFKEFKYNYDKDKNIVNSNALKDMSNRLYYEDNFLGELGKDYTQRNLMANFTEYLYNKNGRKFLRHSVKQKYDFEDKEFGNLIHRLDLYFSNGLNLGNKFEYSNENKRFEKVQSYAGYSDKTFSARLSHSYENIKRFEKYDKDNYLILDTSLNLPYFYKLFAKYEYDLERSYSKMWRLGLTRNRKCWNYTFVYQEDLEPRTSSNFDYKKANRKRAFYFFINFYPFGGVGYDVSKNTDYDKDISKW